MVCLKTNDATTRSSRSEDAAIYLHSAILYEAITESHQIEINKHGSFKPHRQRLLQHTSGQYTELHRET